MTSGADRPRKERSSRRGSGVRASASEPGGPIDPIRAGTIVANRYRVERLLGSGGMGAVYRAVQLSMDRPVALKVLRPEVANDPQMAERFEREARAASRIKSPHVVTIFDFGASDDGTLFLAMELLEGCSLAERMLAGAVPHVEATRIASQIALGLAAAHAVGVVHRDLKPENVWLETDGTAKVLDFGIARLLAGDVQPGDAKRVTQVGAFVGTPLYMSPEAASHEPVEAPADLYALGAIVFEMLTACPVFEEENMVLLLGMHLRVPPERVRDVRPDLEIPASLDDLVDQLLVKAPADRLGPASRVARMLAEREVTGPTSLPDVRTSTPPEAPPPVIERASLPAVAPTPTPAPSFSDAPVEWSVEAPPQHPPVRSRAMSPEARVMAIGGVAIAIVLALVIVGRRSDEDETAPTRPPESIAITVARAPIVAIDASVAAPAPQPPPVVVDRVTVGLSVSPAGADVVVDGEVVGAPRTRQGNSEGIVLHFDRGSEHVIEIRAPRYATATRTISADEDVVLPAIRLVATRRAARPHTFRTERGSPRL
jgi:serine/threonine-protein kinase